MTTENVKNIKPDYIVADIGKAAFGHKEIRIAETEMPGLVQIRDEYQTTIKRSSHCRFFAHDHSNCCVD